MIGAGFPQPARSWVRGPMDGAAWLGAGGGDTPPGAAGCPQGAQVAIRAHMEKLPGEGTWVQAPAREEMLQVVPTPGEAQPRRAGGCVGLRRVPGTVHTCTPVLQGGIGAAGKLGPVPCWVPAQGKSPQDAAQSSPVLSPCRAPARLSTTEQRLLRSRRAAARSPRDHTP